MASKKAKKTPKRAPSRSKKPTARPSAARERARRSTAAKAAWAARKARAEARSKAAKKAAATKAKRRATVAKVGPARTARKARAAVGVPAPPIRRFVEGPPRKSGFALGPHVLRRQKELGRKLTPAEIRRETVPSMRDLAIIEVWPDLSPAARETMGKNLTPAGARLLDRRIRSSKRTAWGLLMETVGLRPVRRAKMKDLSDAEKQALDAWRKGKLDQNVQYIASRAGLSASEVYTLAMSPPSMGRAA